MKNLNLILGIAVGLIICIVFSAFALWAKFANAEFKLALDKPQTAAIENKQAVSVSPSPSPISVSPSPSTYVLKNGHGQLVEVTVGQLALDAWRTDKLLPGKDGKYNWFEVVAAMACWEDYFHKKGINVDDKAFDEAYKAIARQREEFLRERAFERSQE